MIDLKGKKFGKLVIIGRTDNKSSKAGIYWDCECECGRIRSFRSDVLRKTNIKDCGCLPLSIQIGEKIGLLIVKEKIEQNKNERKILWKCECQCEKKKELILSSFFLQGKRGTNTSCGCLNNPSGDQHPSYRGYKEITGRFFHSIERGALSRGIKFKITIEEIWELFEKQKNKCALSNIPIQFGRGCKKTKKYKEGTASLDRIDSTKGYIIENVQWVHKVVNKMKLHHAQEYFIDVCKKIAENN